MLELAARRRQYSPRDTPLFPQNEHRLIPLFSTYPLQFLRWQFHALQQILIQHLQGIYIAQHNSLILQKLVSLLQNRGRAQSQDFQKELPCRSPTHTLFVTLLP